MSIEITTEPIEVIIDGADPFFMQADPTATPEWVTLLEAEVFLTGPKREASHKELTDALAGLAATPQDAETIHALTVGTKTLKRVAVGYIQEVTGFPTVPSASSTRRPKKTGGT